MIMRDGSKKIRISESQYRSLFLVSEGINGFDYGYVKTNIANHTGSFKDTIFIQYGSNKYERDKETQLDLAYDNPKVVVHNKPHGGLWASPLNSSNSWADFLERESFNLRSLASHYLFKISKRSKIYVIDSFDDLYAVSVDTGHLHGILNIDFQKLLGLGCDGIYISEKASRIFHDWTIDIGNNFYMRGLDSWDVESICIFNTDIIIPLDETAFDKARLPKRGLDIDYDADDAYDFQDIASREWLQMQSDYEKYGNQNIRSNMGDLFNGQHPAILAQGHGNRKDTKLARKFDGTIQSGLK